MYAHRVVDRREGVAAVPQVVDRFTVSLDTELLAAFDHHIASLGYENRSEAIRDLIRDELISEKKCGGDGPASVFVTAVCDHRVNDVGDRVRSSLASQADLVRGVLHIPLGEHREGLAVALSGPADRVHSLANALRTLRGVEHAHVSTLPVSD